MTLPLGWESAEIGDLCDLINGKAFKPTDWARSGLPIIRIQNLNRPDAGFNFCDTEVDQRFLVEPGELLFAWSGTPGTSFGAHVWNGPRAVLNQHIFRVLFDEAAVDRDFFKRAINSTLDELINKAHGGVGLAHVTKGKFEATKVPLPPLAEQRRIVAKLDALTARLARARAELDRVPVLATSLRRSTLARAFSGALTTRWRNGETPTDGQYPADWQVRDLGHISEIQGGIQVGKKRSPGTTLIETPYLRVANVQRGWLKLDEIKTLRVTADEKARLTLHDGDVLMNEGGDRDKLGRGWVWRDQIADCIHQNHVFRIRLLDRSFPPEFISHFANEFGQQYFIDQGTQTTNLASISKTKIAALPVPVPPTDEANEIVRLINSAFARADRLEAEAARARALLDRLEAAILTRAFRGELVPQDPADEPATALLARIRAQRAAAPKPKRGRKKKETADA